MFGFKDTTAAPNARRRVRSPTPDHSEAEMQDRHVRQTVATNAWKRFTLMMMWLRELKSDGAAMIRRGLSAPMLVPRAWMKV
jgi:hypothetical protein